MTMNCFFRRAVLLAALSAAAGNALAQATAASTGTAWPVRPIRLLVGYSAGGGVDAMARQLATRLTDWRRKHQPAFRGGTEF